MEDSGFQELPSAWPAFPRGWPGPRIIQERRARRAQAYSSRQAAEEKVHLRGQRPAEQGYPVSPRTIGEQLRKARMDRSLRQRDVANQIGVDLGTLWNWENGRSEPALRNSPMIIRFLGFTPMETGSPFPDRIKRFRRLAGASQARLAERLGVNESTVWSWEKGHRVPSPMHQVLLDDVLTLGPPGEGEIQRLPSPTKPDRF